MSATAMNPATRARALALLGEDELDLLVIGGGATGAGIALDAVTRGLLVGIVEAQDWAAGTSSRSSKLVHGGLRYLQQLDVKLVSEALRERELLLYTLAPHLVKPVSFLYPLHRQWERPYVATGVGLYDTLARVSSRFSSMPIQRHYTAVGVKKLFPGIKSSALIGAVRYWDGRVDDARLVLGLVRTAVEYGALAANRARVESLLRGDGGRVLGAVVHDLETGDRIRVRAKVVIGATGVWTEETQALASQRGLKVLASKGIHIVVPRERIAGETGIILQTEKSVLFIIPWERYWVIGTTDTPYDGPLGQPLASAADVDYVLKHANAILADPLTRADIIGVWAGLRPLVQPGAEDLDSTKISREHTVLEVAPGFLVIAGGKLTTYRVMAEDAVDAALGKDEARARPSRTDRTPLLGAAGYYALIAQADRFGRDVGWDRDVTVRLLDRYGDESLDLLSMARERPDLAAPLHHAPDYLRVEIAYACTHEGVLHLSDLLTCRTRLTHEVPDRGVAALPEIAALAAELLDWDDSRKDAEIGDYLDRCAAEEAAASVA